jgi:hypothetical protein
MAKRGRRTRPPAPPIARPTLEKGDSGPAVAKVQRILGLPADGDFGPVTDAGVRGFQGASGISKDGIVGPQTWGKLDALKAKMAAGSDGISDSLAAQIDVVVTNSGIESFSWPDRGRAPVGYYHGMAKVFALSMIRYRRGDPALLIMGEAETGNASKDALTWYHAEFAAEEMPNDVAGIDTLRHLFVMLIGLGMRESSGNHWEGRDTSASNTSADTAEAGLFQTSWNIRSCSSTIPPLLTEFWADPNGFRPSFDRGVSPTASNLDNFGRGQGTQYQWLAKFSPAFHALVTGVGMRRLRRHWGPINRRKVDIVGRVDDLLISVQNLVDANDESWRQPGGW